jgi:hypothetical protein
MPCTLAFEFDLRSTARKIRKSTSGLTALKEVRLEIKACVRRFLVSAMAPTA